MAKLFASIPPLTGLAGFEKALRYISDCAQPRLGAAAGSNLRRRHVVKERTAVSNRKTSFLCFIAVNPFISCWHTEEGPNALETIRNDAYFVLPAGDVASVLIQD